MTLWFFRTPGGKYFFGKWSPSLPEMALIEKVILGGFIGFDRKPAGMPKLKCGECIPVELVPAVKKKKARKG